MPVDAPVIRTVCILRDMRSSFIIRILNGIHYHHFEWCQVSGGADEGKQSAGRATPDADHGSRGETFSAAGLRGGYGGRNNEGRRPYCRSVLWALLVQGGTHRSIGRKRPSKGTGVRQAAPTRG